MLVSKQQLGKSRQLRDSVISLLTVWSHNFITEKKRNENEFNFQFNIPPLSPINFTPLRLLLFLFHISWCYLEPTWVAARAPLSHSYSNILQALKWRVSKNICRFQPIEEITSIFTFGDLHSNSSLKESLKLTKVKIRIFIDYQSH